MSKQTKDYFDVAVKVLECSNLSTQIKDVSTQICVQVGDEKRYSKMIHHTTKPFFDEYFVFTKLSSLFEFTESLITISALHARRGLKMRKLIGCISMDVATIWHQPNRRLKKWFALSLPSDRSMQKKAFIECDLKIVANSTYFELYQLLNLESSEMIGSKRARYKVLIYHCTGLQVQVTKKYPPVSVRVSYAGKSGITTRKQIEELVEWNEQISFVELFPPMRQRLTLEVLVGKKVLAFKSFNIIDFFKIFHGGFLNMFGPAYIHLYTEQDLYRGSLLISLESEIIGQLREFEYVHPVSLANIEPISQIKYGVNKEFVCFGIVFGLMITKPNCGTDDIYLSLEMGSIKKVESKRYLAISCDQFLHVTFSEKKPCISLTCEWPDCTHRLYNSNLMANIVDVLREKLNTSFALTSRGCTEEAKKLLGTTFQHVKQESNKVIRLLSKGITELDAKRSMFLKNQINILSTLLTSDVDLDTVIELSTFFLSVIDSCCEDIQDSLPSLTISLHQGNDNIGSCILHPRHLIFSEVTEKRGRNSAKINNLVFKGVDGEIVARMDVWLWLGKREQINKCKEQLPPGYKPYTPSKVKKDRLFLPASLTYPSSHTYTAICHIHSAYIDEEAVSVGECDSYVKVCFNNQCRQTVTAKRTLAPTWKETLILRDIKLYSAPDYLVENPPSLTLQLWNETTDPPKLVGFMLIGSTVTLQSLTEIPEFAVKWLDVGNRCEVLGACELFKTTATPEIDSEEVFSMFRHSSIIPRHVEPLTAPYRLEVVFWGIRPSYPRALKNIVQPQISIQISTATISSGVISRANTTFNFRHDTRIVSLNLPENKIYSPPLIIKIMSNFKYLMSISEKNIHRYEYQLPKKSQWESLNARRSTDRSTLTSGASHRVTMPDLIPQTEVTDKSRSAIGTVLGLPSAVRHIMRDSIMFRLFQSQDTDDSSDSSDDEADLDWWDRYRKNHMKIYDTTLEDQDMFSGFTDVLSTFPIKQRQDNTLGVTEIGKLKAIFSLYKWPVEEPVVTMQGQDPEMGVLKLSERNSRVNLLIRVYCIKATDLYPSDLNGKSDPYIEIATPSKTVSDSANKILGELNPVFGNFLEVIATLPVDSLLAVRVMDWDLFSKDDIIGETIIDIENRFYSRHRATCGLPETYSTVGPNSWRDIETPKEILERLCNDHNLPLPQYYDKSVKIGSKEFVIHKTSIEKGENLEKLALVALNNWEEMPIVGRPLVREHVETRFLFREDRPGLVRGKLTMWVDMFDMSLGNIPLPLNTAPRKPQGYELRVNILNTAKIPLIDESAIGDRRCTDIVVTGWLGDYETIQKTDVHHNSYNGTGNFNWRFVFPFLYYRKEKKMVFYKKNLFDIGKTEHKVPPVLNLEVFDSEVLLEDSFIGGMMLDLCRMPRGAHSVSACKPEMVFDPSNHVDLFRVEHVRGWWPFLLDKVVMKERGFLEAEFFLITDVEALKCPVGLGRSPPDPLSLPARELERKSPFRVLQDLIARHNCQSYFGHSLNIFIVLCLLALIGALIYTLPSTIEKLKPWLEESFDW